MTQWLVHLIEHNGGADAVEEQGVNWTPTKWAAVAATSNEAKDAVERLTQLAPQRISRACVRDMLSTQGPVPGFVAAMTWGFGPVSYGPSRVMKMLTKPRGEGGPLATIESVVAAATTDGAKAGFSSLWFDGRSRVYGLGTAFGTKVLHFAATEKTPGPQPLILDQFVYRGAQRLVRAGAIAEHPVPDPGKYMTGSLYEDYCGWAAGLAEAGRVTPATVEFALFSLGRRASGYEKMLQPR